ncbi:hypothetical protein PCC7424_5199 [Gloeothece citriformis PCC 7424]|uniref:Uncharacterized protein n=1 Tax=Gloeothece citriformis (strain PCC 7424) TaxID=65393 RepID=B7KI61_GLOC7|nr:hypothetical protein [Gloeothece citriformis]ACK73548.1 hypothetical protein PCC7424_5199 [Gloeothece citriformis PCC 7424]
MRVWLATCIVLFVLVQFYQWVKGFFLPLPIYVLAGAFLAIASNYDKGIGFILKQSSQTITPLSQSATLVEDIQSLEGEQTQSLALESEKTNQEE